MFRRWSTNGWETLDYLTSLAIREKQIKTAFRFHLTLVRMAKISKIRDSSRWQGCGKRGILIHGCQPVELLWNQCGGPSGSWESIYLQIPLVSLLGMYPKDSTSYHRDSFPSMPITALFIAARRWEPPRYPSTDEWIVKMWSIYPALYSC